MASPSSLLPVKYNPGQAQQDKIIAENPKIDQCRLKAEISRGGVIHRKDTGEEENWTQVKMLAEGGQGFIYLQKKATTTELRVVKKVPISYSGRGAMRELYHMVAMMDRSDLFIKFFGWYESKRGDLLYLAMEYLELGDLGKYIEEFGRQEEEKSREITRQLLEGLTILHQRKICHRDLKPENIFIASLSPIRVKIADFGISKSTVNTDLRTQCGTQGYIAPELQGYRPRNYLPGNDYSHAVDIWGLGCLVHEILTSEVPFSETSFGHNLSEISCLDSTPYQFFDMERFATYCTGGISFPTESLQHSQVSDRCVDFVKSLLAVDPNSRPSAPEALNDIWLSRV